MDSIFDNFENKFSEEEYEEMFKKVKECINNNRFMNKYQISRMTNVPIDVINKFIKEGRLEEKVGSLGFDNENKSGMSEERRRELVNGLKKQLLEEQNRRTGSSRLVDDLNEKYKNDRDDR